MDKAAYVPVSVQWGDVVVAPVLQTKERGKDKSAGRALATNHLLTKWVVCSLYGNKAAGEWRSG